MDKNDTTTRAECMDRHGSLYELIDKAYQEYANQWLDPEKDPSVSRLLGAVVKDVAKRTRKSNPYDVPKARATREAIRQVADIFYCNPPMDESEFIVKIVCGDGNGDYEKLREYLSARDFERFQLLISGRCMHDKSDDRSVRACKWRYMNCCLNPDECTHHARKTP